MNNLNEWITRKIQEALRKERRDKTWLSDQTGIPYSTLNRKMAGRAEFRFSELLTIAEVLNLAPQTFLPSGFVSQAHVAA